MTRQELDAAIAQLGLDVPEKLLVFGYRHAFHCLAGGGSPRKVPITDKELRLATASKMIYSLGSCSSSEFSWQSPVVGQHDLAFWPTCRITGSRALSAGDYAPGFMREMVGFTEYATERRVRTDRGGPKATG